MKKLTLKEIEELLIISKSLKNFRKKHNIKFREFAEILKLTPSQLISIETLYRKT